MKPVRGRHDLVAEFVGRGIQGDGQVHFEGRHVLIREASPAVEIVMRRVENPRPQV